GYFSGSTKVRKSVFPFIKDKLEIAFENSAWLRLQSEQNEQDIPEYDRNPYITTDDIVKRLTGIETNWIWILTNKKYQFKNFAIFIDNQKSISISNDGKITMLIPEGSIVEVDRQTNTRKSIGNQIFINAGESKMIVDLDEVKSDSWFIFAFEKYRIMFEF
ncbi:MAG: hypothetical protein Q7J86_07075, partial [Bacteroidota bacterium]|nr:hypothetical protein [Bacteroidota bacterium]